MIVINKSGFLKYKNFKFKCALGKKGIRKKKKERDDINTKKKKKIINLFYRNN